MNKVNLERRRFLRFALPIKVEFPIDKKGEIVLQGEGIDFSRQGVRMTFPADICLVRNSVEIKLRLPDRQIPISLNGEIVWRNCTQTKSEIGLRIDKIGGTDKSDILDYVYQLWCENRSQMTEARG